MAEDTKQAASKVSELFSTRSKAAVGGLVALGAVVVAVVRQRRRSHVIEFPEPGTLAAETGSSVRNAAKGALISRVREAEHPDVDLMAQSAESAVGEAARSGVDLTEVAIGVVEGGMEVAHLLEMDPRAAAGLAARAAVGAAENHGQVAGDRVRDVLGSQVDLA